NALPSMLHANVDPPIVEVNPKLTLALRLAVLIFFFGTLVRIVFGAGGVSAPTAASAFTSPPPWKLAGTPAIGDAVVLRALLIALVVADGNFWRSRAATAAACGAAADVPQKVWLAPKKKVVRLQSLATMSGLFTTRGVVSAGAGETPLTGPKTVVTG